MKVEEIKSILGDKYLSKSEGQVLLLDENIAKKIANLVNCVEDGKVLEIGPGLGIITKYLIKKEYKVITVERDRDFCKYLNNKGIDVINEDFLKLPIAESLPEVVIGALPFSISIKILLRLKDYRNHFKKWVVVIQREVAERLTSKPNKKSFSSLSVIFQILYNMGIEFDISQSSFFPEPMVTSTVLKASIYENPIVEVTDKFENFVQAIFRFRRKTLKNNLFDYNTKNVSISLSRRAESLTIGEIVKLYKEINA